MTVLFKRSELRFRLELAFGLIIHAFFAVLFVGGAVVTAVQLLHGVKLQPLQALGAAFALLIGWFVVKSFFTSLAALLLPVRVVKGQLEHANKVTHEGSRRNVTMWHLMVDGVDYSIRAHEVAHYELLLPGRPVELHVARDGEVVQLEADERVRVEPPKLPPAPRTIQSLTLDELARVRRWAWKRLGGFCGASLGTAVLAFGTEGPFQVFFAFASVVFTATSGSAVVTVQRARALEVGTAAVLLEGRSRASFGAWDGRSIDGRPVADAALRSPHALARKVRARAISVPTPGIGASGATVVVQWLAETN
jgi:hypothetical protein